MAVQPTGTDVTVVYTDQTHVERYLPQGLIVTGSTSPGSVSTSQLSDIIDEFSREIDSALWAKGFQTPFRDISLSNPQCPRIIVRMCTYMVVGEVRTISKFGNREATSASEYTIQGHGMLDTLIANPLSIGYGRVSSPEQFINRAANVGTNQWGKLTATYYRLANRNLTVGSLKFVNSAGTEVFRSDGLPFDYGRDWAVVSYSESVIIILNEAEIISACGTGGGMVYEFSWRRLEFGQGHPQPISGVSRL